MSLWPQLREPAKAGRNSAWTIVTRGDDQRGDSIRTDRWRLTLWSDGAVELYDHQTDPQETFNVSKSHSDVVEQLVEEIDRRRSVSRK